MKTVERLRAREIVIYSLITVAVAFLCVFAGSVPTSLQDTARSVFNAIRGIPQTDTVSTIILSVRLPRVLCAAFTGASLSLCGAVMQALLRNPLADGTTLGVSAGASLGAVLAIVFGVTFPALPLTGTVIMAIAFAFLSMLLVLLLSYSLDRSLSSVSIILIGVVFSMFVSSITGLVTAFAGDKVKSVVFWTMGSLSGCGYQHVLLIMGALLVCGFILMHNAAELNAFSVSEDNARQVGVRVRRVRLTVMITVSVLIGVSVSISGTIGFVGLIIPHITRFITGPNHKRLLPAALFFGAVFLMLCDLVARTVLNPVELSVGIVTSLIGAAVFIAVFIRSRKRR